MRSLGEFVGHIARAVKTDPGARGDAPASRREVRREVEERPGEVDGRKVTLRRTIIEEVRFDDAPYAEHREPRAPQEPGAR